MVFFDGYFVVKGTMIYTSIIKILFQRIKHPFFSRLSKVNATLIDNAQELNAVLPMHNLIEYQQKLFKCIR